MNTLKLITLAGCLLFASSASAKGNHFILELEAGSASPTGVSAESQTGSSYAGTFGIGGRIRGIPPAFYLVARLGASHFGFTGPPHTGRPFVDREQTEFALGARVYFPLFSKRVRLLTQLGLGEISDDTMIERQGHRPLLVSTDAFAMFLALGLEFRLTEGFSLGVIADTAFVPNNQTETLVQNVTGIADGGELGRTRVAVAATFHF